MAFNILFSISFLIALVIFIVLLGISIKKYPEPVDESKLPKYIPRIPTSDEYDTNHMPPRKKYSIMSRMISGLGNLFNGGAKYFNAAVKLIGIFLAIMGCQIFLELPAHWTTCLGCIFFIIGGVGMFLLGIYTENRHAKHGIVANICFGGFFGSSVVLIYPMLVSGLFWSGFIIFNVIIIISILYYFYSMRNFNVPLEMQDTRPEQLSKNYDFSEWMLFFSVFAWIVMIFFSLI